MIGLVDRWQQALLLLATIAVMIMLGAFIASALLWMLFLHY